MNESETKTKPKALKISETHNDLPNPQKTKLQQQMPSSCSEIQFLSVSLQYLHKTGALSLHSNVVIQGGCLQRKTYGPIYSRAKRHK